MTKRVQTVLTHDGHTSETETAHAILANRQTATTHCSVRIVSRGERGQKEVASNSKAVASATIFLHIEQDIDNEVLGDHSHVEDEGIDSLLLCSCARSRAASTLRSARTLGA